MVTIDTILNNDGKEVYPLIYRLIMSDPSCSKELIDTLKANKRYQEDSYFRISVDSANMVAHGLGGDHEAVIAMAPEIIERAEALEMHKLLATNWNNLGTTYATLQNLERSLECYCHLVNIETKYGYLGLRSIAYYNLSAIFYQVGGHEKSIEYIELAVESLKEDDLDDPVIGLRYLMFNSLYLQLLCRTGNMEKAKELYFDLKGRVEEETARESVFSFYAAEMYYHFYCGDRSNCIQHYERLIQMVDEKDVVRKYMILYAYVEMCEEFQVDYKFYGHLLLQIEQMPDFSSGTMMSKFCSWLRKYYLHLGRQSDADYMAHRCIEYLEKSLLSYEEQQLHSLETVESLILGTPNDYGSKNVELKLLANEAIKNKQLLEEAYRQLERISSLDGLTRIRSRRDFEERFIELLEKAKKQETNVSVFMMDIDHFKIYNDTYGHLEGDEVLKKVAVEFNKALESVNGLAARFGGEEFIGACKGLSLEETRNLAKKIRGNVSKLHIENKKTPLGIVTVSIGGAVGSRFTPKDKSLFMKMADVSLYSAKKKGRNKAVVVDLDPNRQESISG